MKIFVYGSLKKGFPNSRLLIDSNFLGEAITSKNYCMIDMGAYPGVVKPDNKNNTIGKVVGEVYEIDEKTLFSLDRLEGNGYFYQREQIVVCLPSQPPMEVFMYFLLKSPYNPLKIFPNADGVIEWMKN